MDIYITNNIGVIIVIIEILLMNKLFKVPDVKPQLVDMKKDLQIMKINVNDSTKQQYVIKEEVKESQQPSLVTCDKQAVSEIPQQHSSYQNKPCVSDSLVMTSKYTVYL